jgi:hypothetical protein
VKSPLPEEQGPTFEPTIHWCARHLEPFRAEWPVGWPLAMMGLFQESVRNLEIIDAAGGQTEMLDRVLREFSPLCCFLGDEITAKWTRLSQGSLDEFRAALAAL